MKTTWCDDKTAWDNHVNQFDGHPLQLWGWGEAKSSGNWQAHRLLVEDDQGVIGGASIMLRLFPGPIPPLAYVSRGPFGDQARRDELLSAITAAARQRFKPLAVSVEPEWSDFPDLTGWRQAASTIIIPETGLIDLSRNEDELLGQMAKKTRQYVHKSARANLVVRSVETADELAACLTIYHQTAERAGFALHSDDYYQAVYQQMGQGNILYGAWSDGVLVAFLWVVASQTTAFELYGGVNEAGQRLRANYTLKWQVMQQCKKRGITRYDLNGLLNDGISTFKRGFIDQETHFVGTYDYKMSAWYPLYARGLPLAKRLARLVRR